MKKKFTNTTVNQNQLRVRLTSNKNEELIHPSELLLPLNSLVNLINLLENFENLYDEYTHKQDQNNINFDFAKTFERRLMYSRIQITANQEKNAVMIEAMSKKSPYWVDLIVNASPYIIKAIQILIEEHEDDVEDGLIELLSNFNCFNDKKRDDKLIIARRIISNIRFISRFVNIFIHNNEE